MLAHRLVPSACAAAVALSLAAPAIGAEAKYATTCFFQSRGFPPRDVQRCMVSESADATHTKISVALKDGTTYAEHIVIGGGAKGGSLQNLRSGFGARQAGTFTCAGVKGSADQICFDIGKPDVIAWPG